MTIIRDFGKGAPVVVDKANNIIVRKVRDHWEILVGGKFHCSCDSPAEVDAEVARIGGGA